jgi:enoyl-CoA hydratase/carnithine racemase
MRTDFNTLLIERVDDGIIHIVLNRPDVRNAVSHEMQAEIDTAMDEAELDDSVKAVVLRGQGRAFSAGHDLKEQLRGESFPALTFPMARPSTQPKMPRAWYFRKPLIGSVHGYVGPYAIALVACCDFNIAAEETHFGCEVFQGHYPDIVWLPLYAQLPMRVIEKLFLVGGWMDAEQALHFQFVQRVVPGEELEEETTRWARHCARIPTPQFAHAKDKIRRSIELMGMSSMHAVLEDHIQMARLWADDTQAEGDQLARDREEGGFSKARRGPDSDVDQDVARV